MSETYLIRHGQTAWNAEKRFRGCHDVPLNSQGRREALCAAQALADIQFCAVFSSPLSRAIETAEIISGQRNLLIFPDQSFIDINYGTWTGMADSEVCAQFPETYSQWLAHPDRVVFPEGESLVHVRRRAVAGLRRVAQICAGHPVAIITHRVVLKVLLAALKGKPDSSFWDITVDTASISTLRTDAAAIRLIHENDVRHLEGLDARERDDF